MQHMDGMLVGGGIAAALLFAYLFHLCGDPVEKVEARPEAPRGSAPGPFAELRRRARAWRELRASRRRAAALARIKLSSPDSFGGIQPEKPWPRR
jgi:hypothetical protein